MTAETAVALPAVVVVLAMLLWGLAAGAAAVQCVDSARAGARALARGEAPAAARAAVRAAAPRGADVALSRRGGLAVVTVRARVDPPGPLAGVVPGIPVGARAATAAEPPT